MAAPTAGGNSSAGRSSSSAAMTPCAPSRSASTSRPRASAGRSPTLVRPEKRPPISGIVVEHRDAEMPAQRAQAVGLAAHRGLGQAEEQFRDAVREPRCRTASSAAMICTKVSGVPPDFEVTTKRVVLRSSPAKADQAWPRRDCRRSAAAAAPRCRVCRRPGCPSRESCASVCPPRLDPPVPKKTRVRAPWLRSCNASRAGGMSSRRSATCSKGSVPAACASRSDASRVSSFARRASSEACGRPARRSALRGSLRWTG